MRISKLNVDDIIKIKILYMNGHKIKSIAEKFEVSYNVVYSALKNKRII